MRLTPGSSRAFLVQIPPVLLALVMVQWRLQLPTKHSDLDESKWEKLQRVDFFGAAFLCYAIFTVCFVLDVGGQRVPFESPLIIGFVVSGILSAVCFLATAKVVKEPIFPLKLLLNRDLSLNYVVVALAVGVQLALMMSVPIYFRKSSRSTSNGVFTDNVLCQRPPRMPTQQSQGCI